MPTNFMEHQILEIIREFERKLPKFPDGRIDYTNSDIAPVLCIFAKHKNKILLLKRSNKVANYRGKWNAISGFLDETKQVREKVLDELKEELGISENQIIKMHFGKFHEIRDNSIKKIWLVCPVLVELKEIPEIKLDWEHTEFRWIKKEDLCDYDIVPELDKSLKNALE